jgi:hypothetical protein
MNAEMAAEDERRLQEEEEAKVLAKKNADLERQRLEDEEREERE